MFRDHLFERAQLLDRGDLAATDMVGSWAGELGQTQMMPSEYLKYAVDYDGDGHRNLLRSPADVIGSTANYHRRARLEARRSRGCRKSVCRKICRGSRPGSM